MNPHASQAAAVANLRETDRVRDLRRRIRAAMSEPPVVWECPERIEQRYFDEPIPIRKARAIELKLATMPVDLWDGQLIAGSMTGERPRLHAERPFPQYVTDAELAAGAARGLSTNCFGHIVPDYPTLLAKGLAGIRDEAEAQRGATECDTEIVFLDSVVIALDAVVAYAERVAQACDAEALQMADAGRATELRQMAANLRQAPAGAAKTFAQALQAVWLLHMIFHSTRNGNAIGRLDQYAWPLLAADLDAGRLDMAAAAELVDCFCLKFNERAAATEDQGPDHRPDETPDPHRRSRHHTSSQLGTDRDGLDATNHWLQNIVIGGLTGDGADGTDPLTYLLLDSYGRNEMTNPLLTVRLHRDTPAELLTATCEVLKSGGGMPALFNDEAIIAALEAMGIAGAEARDYTNDGCWEVIIPGRTDFGFLRLSAMLCLEWVLNRGRPRIQGAMAGIDTGDACEFTSFGQVWEAFAAQLDSLVERTVAGVVESINNRHILAPVPLLSSLIDGAIASRKDMTAGGATHRLFALLVESAAHAIDSLVAIKTVIFDEGAATMAELCDALDSNFQAAPLLRKRLLAAPKYGNDDERADRIGRDLIALFTRAAARHAASHEPVARFYCGVGTFSWYIGIGEGLGASPDGRLAGEPVSSNFSPALGRDVEGIPGAILSYAKMHHGSLAAGGPLDLRMPARLVAGDAGTDRMAALCRSFVDTGGTMMTLTVADTDELREAQRHPERHESLRVRMGGWSAYFTMLSRQQQTHHIRRQEGRG